MAFVCPNCTKSALEIELGIELQANDNWDENTFQLATCRHCGLRAAALYQESRRGNLEEEAWQHFGVVITPETYRLLAERLGACPAPGDYRCLCAAHRTLDLNTIFLPDLVPFQLVRPAPI